VDHTIEEINARADFLEQALDAAGLGWWQSDLGRGGGLTWSAATYRIFGLTPAKFDGTMGALFRFVHAEDAGAVSAAIAAAYQGRAPCRMEHRIVRPGGSIRWVNQSVVVAGDQDGAATRMLGICQDVTDRKRIEDQNRAAADHNRGLIDASLDPLVAIGPDGTITDVSAATEQATGYRRDELVGTEFSDYFSDPGQARAGYQQAFLDTTVRDYPLELRHRDGHMVSVLCNASVDRDPSGKVRAVFAALRDITPFKAAQTALRDSEQRLHAIFDTAPAGIYDVAPSGEFVRVNPRFCQLIGYTADALQSLRMQDIIHPDDLHADLADTERLLSGEIDAYTIEKRFLRRDGGVVWAEVNRAAVRDQAGTTLLLVGVTRDMTAQRQAEAEVASLTRDLETRVEQRTTELEQVNRNLQAFTYSVSHDLRAPLRALSGFAEALTEEYGDSLPDTASGYVQRIGAASERMAALIDDLLRLSRLSRAEMDLQPADLSAEVAAIAAELRSHEPGREVRIGIQEGVLVTADRNLIRAVLQNLLDNAWKFTARRADASIEFGTVAADDAAVCCFVRDNGAGFDPAYAGKLFQPFQRLHPVTEFPGTGVGLATVRQIIERHGGRTWAEGTVGGGATFYFTLNAKPQASATSHAGREKPC
jgi:PAS domain S-box-containing protein